MPVPKSGGLGGKPLRDLELLKWCTDLVNAVFEPGKQQVSATGS